MQFDAVLRTFVSFFDREGIRHAVIGGMAMQAWGHSRFTKDLDFVVSQPGCWDCSMSSRKRAELLDLETAVPTTAEDIAALNRARDLNHLSPKAYLAFLTAFSKQYPPTRETSEGWEPFEL